MQNVGRGVGWGGGIVGFQRPINCTGLRAREGEGDRQKQRERGGGERERQRQTDTERNDRQRERESERERERERESLPRDCVRSAVMSHTTAARP